MSAVIEVNVKDIQTLAQKLNGFALTDAQAGKLLHSLGKEVAVQTEERFDEERDPEGKKWLELTEAYAKRKAKGSSGGILNRKGFMSKITFQVKGGASVLVGSAMEYADYHQRAKKQTRLRRFLGLNKDNIAGLSELTDDFMEGKAGG
jgi:phage virion morphogenesis protein